MFDALLGLAGGVLGGIGSIYGAQQGNDAALKAVQEQNRGNMEMAKYAYSRNLDMWERQNVYNSPAEQMRRLIEAGLNPNLMYGQGSTGNAQSAPQMSAPQMSSYTGFGDLGASAASKQLMEGLQSYAQIKKTNAETQAIRQNTENMSIQGEGYKLHNIYQGFLNSKSEVEYSMYKDRLLAELANLDSSAVRNYASAQFTDSQRFYTDDQRTQFNIIAPLAKQQVETNLKQSLFELYKLSPAKLNSIITSNSVQKLVGSLTELKTKLLSNDLEFSNYKIDNKDVFFEVEKYLKSSEREIRQELIRSGINLKGSNWFTPLLHLIEREIALPIGNFIDSLF